MMIIDSYWKQIDLWTYHLILSYIYSQKIWIYVFSIFWET